MKKTALAFIFLIYAVCSLQAQQAFTNPIKATGPDPWVIYRAGWYYFMSTVASAEGENELKIWRTQNMAELSGAEEQTVFRPEGGKPYSKQLWAPELHYLDGKWYIYFAADDGNNLHHRTWVLENGSPDPFEGEWTLKGKLSDPGDHWAIDMTILDWNGKRYAAWSGWKNYNNEQQNIYIAELENPWTMKGDRVLISQPTYNWELHGKVPVAWQKATGEPPYLRINEGPEFLQHNGKLFLVYSANACWLDYNMGMLQYTGKGSLLDPKSWKKYPKPVFQQDAAAGIFAPGHNSFFKSPDGREDWILYHANPSATDGCGNKRAPHMQKFGWTKNGLPYFGKPVKGPMPLPSGTGLYK